MRELRTRIERGWNAEEALSTATAIRPSRARNLIAAFGEEKSVAEWSRDARASVSSLTIAARVQRGWDPEEAITTPVHGKVRPPRQTAPRPPRSRRPRMLMSNEEISDLDADAVRQRLEAGAELWFAGSSGDRVSIVQHDETTLVSPEVLKELESAGVVVPVCRLGSLVQYDLAPKPSKRGAANPEPAPREVLHVEESLSDDESAPVNMPGTLSV